MTVRFLPSNQEFIPALGDALLDIALDNSLPLEHECGGNCACTTCCVFIREGEFRLSKAEAAERNRLISEGIADENARLACQALVKREGLIVVSTERLEPGIS